MEKEKTIKGVTPTGFRYYIKESAVDNFELLEDLAKADEGDMGALIRATVTLLGEKQKKKLYDHLRTKEGNVPIESFTQEIIYILEHASKN